MQAIITLHEAQVLRDYWKVEAVKWQGYEGQENPDAAAFKAANNRSKNWEGIVITETARGHPSLVGG